MRGLPDDTVCEVIRQVLAEGSQLFVLAEQDDSVVLLLRPRALNLGREFLEIVQHMVFAVPFESHLPTRDVSTGVVVASWSNLALRHPVRSVSTGHDA